MQNENYMAMHLQGLVNFEILEANLLTVVLPYTLTATINLFRIK